MPGFCIFYTETNEKNFDYEKLHWLFMAICLAVMPALQSCDDNDGYSLGNFTPPLWATVRVTGNAFYLNCDVWGTLWPVNTDIGWYDAVDGQRVITVFNPLWDNYAGYDHAVKLLRLQNVLTKEVEMLIPETEEEFGNDPVLIYKGDITISGGYMNIFSCRTCHLRLIINTASAWCVRKKMMLCMAKMDMSIWNSAITTMMT